MFIFPLKIVLKTCGTTKLLLSIEPILKLAESLSLDVSDVKYSRGSFIFPNYQPAPHRSFSEEVNALNGFFSCLKPKAYVLLGDPASPNRNWHIYSASSRKSVEDRTDMITFEMCMTGLDKKKAAVFFKRSADADYSAKEMTRNSGISEIIPSHAICDFDFDPCGYSMNGIEGSGFSTVHVTPEDGFSYASYEAMGFDASEVNLNSLASRVLKCFEPNEFSIAVTCHGSGVQRCTMECGDVDGYWCRSVVQELAARGGGGGGGWVVYRSYEKKEKEHHVVASPAKVSMQCWKEVEEEEEVMLVMACL
ncbi:hypothetical protein GH714_006983 [Hevea brasiliensis]|uniref:Adenosylmethionine decarboxylase n=1 Tax=Hevea brasiliensis TaxID=3981 RepID=A0A6A6MCC7_HEVBR|nr:hypothetical protein GH714_006983 [Hevea brasiliensis]